MNSMTHIINDVLAREPVGPFEIEFDCWFLTFCFHLIHIAYRDPKEDEEPRWVLHTHQIHSTEGFCSQIDTVEDPAQGDSKEDSKKDD